MTSGLVRRRLPGGARILCLEAGSADAPVAVQLWIAAGTAAERPQEHGCAHLLEHMLFKPYAAGGPAAASGDLARAIETLGGDVNAFTSHDETVLHATVPSPAWGGAVDAILWAALRPALDAAETLREREVVVEEIKQYDDEPGQKSVQALLGRLHAGHAYARPVLGLTREVRSHTARRLRAFHRRTYAGERLTLVVVGPVAAADVVARARRLLAAAGEGAPLRRGRPAEAAPSRIHAIVDRGDVQEAHLFFGWRGPGLGDPAVAALDVAGVVLGHGEASRLVREVRRSASTSSVTSTPRSISRAGRHLRDRRPQRGRRRRGRRRPRSSRRSSA
ncbi:MAG: pitrilysin family protein [Nannocystaceae bacterium]